MKLNFILLVLLSCGYVAIGQNENPIIEFNRQEFAAKQVISPSPDAASLGKFGNVPVSLFTGAPSISVPLMEMKGNMLSLPVSLSYSSSGFKPEEIASWVGLGWSLNSGGVITRSVLGNPDVLTNYFMSPSPLVKPTDALDILNYHDDIRRGLKETQPDVYYYNFMGHSGKFTIRPTGQVVQNDRTMLSISSCISCNEFTIKDEQGNTYVFSALEKTHMIPSDEEGNPSYIFYTFNSSWYLTSVKSPGNREIINFEYYTASEEQTIHSNILNNESNTYTLTSSSCSYLTQTVPQSNLNTFIPYDTRLRERKFIKRATLVRDTLAVSYIEFESNADERQDLVFADFTGERTLKHVKLYNVINGQDILAKKFDLDHGYFGTPGSFAVKLKLNGIQEISTNTNTSDMPPYLFEYNSNPIPDRFTPGIDHWGYYNGASNLISGQPTLIPDVVIDPVNAEFLAGTYGRGANRESDFGSASTAVLQKITYPAKGFTTFEFEANSARDNSGTTRLPGGLRIKRIVDYSSNSMVAGIRSFEYKLEDGQTSGEIRQWPRYYEVNSYSYSSVGCFPATCTPSTSLSCWNYVTRTLSISAGSVFGLGSTQGSHVAYNRVIERQVDGSGLPLGYKVYNYNLTLTNEYDDHIGNGDLIKEEVYGSGKLLSETVNNYTYSLVEAVTIRKLRASKNQDNYKLVCKLADNQLIYYRLSDNQPSGCVATASVPAKYQVDDYSMNAQEKKLLSQVQKVYDQKSNSYLVNTKTFTYGNPNHIYPTKTEQVSFNDEKVVTLNKYSADYSIPNVNSSDIAFVGIKQLVVANMNGIPIESVQYRENANGSNRRVVSGNITTYNNYLPVQVDNLELSAPLSTIDLSSFDNSGVFVSNSAYKKAGSFLYNYSGNVIEQGKLNDISTSYLWGHNNSYPIAQVVNAHADQIAYTSFETDEGGGWNNTVGNTYNNNTIITGKRTCSGSVSKSIAPGNYIVSLWATGSPSVNGTTTSAKRISSRNSSWKYYEWSLFNVTTINVVAGEMDEVRLYPDKAQMTTYTYDIPGGVSSQTDSRNQLSYFDYDGLGRLLNVKDDAGNIIKNYRYNYGPGGDISSSALTMFYNGGKSEVFTKDGSSCPPLAVPTSVTYTVPFGKYVSSISQADANAKQQQEITDNGQNNANEKGLCVWYNTITGALKFKNDCLYSQGTGSKVGYTVPAGRYSSLISQADADAQAAADVLANAQAYANTHGTCSCVDEGKKFINGVCETGYKWYEGSSFVNGQYKCKIRYQWSDNTFSDYYYEYRSTPCPQNN